MLISSTGMPVPVKHIRPSLKVMPVTGRQYRLYRCAVRFSDGKSIVAIRNGFAVASAKFPCFKLNTKLQAAVAVLPVDFPGYL